MGDSLIFAVFKIIKEVICNFMEAKKTHRSNKIRSAAKDEFNDWAGGYDQSILQHWLFKPSHDLIVNEIDLEKPNRILDIGCGTCVLAFRLSQESPKSKFCCVDLAHEMVKTAKDKRDSGRHSVETVGNIKIKIADSEHLPYASNTFDYITCSNSFHHYPHQDNVAREMHRVLKPGGKALIVDGYKDSVLGGIIYDGIVGLIEGDVHHLNSRQFKDLFGKFGFDPVSHISCFRRLPIMIVVAVAKK
ncbi:class I SAM-dependent methyltransferase [Candidatus Auribacterota bacterium]